MGFEDGRVSPAETCLVLAETSLTRKENKEDQNNSFDDSAVTGSKEDKFDNNGNPKRTSLVEPRAPRTTKSPFARDPRAKRQFFDRLLLLVTFVSFGSLILVLSIAFGGLRSKCACSGTFEKSQSSSLGEGDESLSDKMKAFSAKLNVLERQMDIQEEDITKHRDDIIALRQQDKRIVGATCSTDDAAEYRLIIQRAPSGEMQYKCYCAGQSSLMQSSNGEMTCSIHYLECPLVT